MVKQHAKKYRITNSKSDKIFDAVNIVIMILLLFILSLIHISEPTRH